jgi:hypothetical protein
MEERRACELGWLTEVRTTMQRVREVLATSPVDER